MPRLKHCTLAAVCCLLCYPHGALSQSPTEAREGWQADGNTRSSWDILWSSLATIFACTWSLLHLNAPGLNDSDTKILLRRIKWFLVAVLAPELIITMALAQFLEARRTVAGFSKYNHENSIRPVTGSKARDPNDAASSEEAIQTMEKSVFDGSWTLVHGYLTTMGALIVQTHDDEYSVLQEDDALKLLASGQANFPQIQPRDIKDRSKADSFAKLFALAQSGWLLINILGRAAYKLPISPIEFITLAYVVCAFIIYGFWWSKPKDIMVPMIIKMSLPAEMSGKEPEKPGVKPGLEDYIGTVAARRKNLDDTPDNTLVTGAAAVIAVIYSGIHIAAWNFDFVTSAERIAWQVCSVGSTIAPVIALLCPLFLLAEKENAPWISWSRLCVVLAGILYMVCLISYVVARITLLVLAFMAMRSLPVGCYDTIDWVHALPHF